MDAGQPQEEDEMMRKVVPILALGGAALAAELPVRQVTLYKHGVGFFERRGDIAAGQTARLDFKATEMNDVLKSLTVDGQGGKVTGLRYDSSEALDDKLSRYPFRVGEQQSLGALLDQFKGAGLELTLGPNETVLGTIIGARTIAGNERTPARDLVTLLLASGEIRSVDLSAASRVRFTDPSLQLQLRDYLQALSQARSQERRSVYIDAPSDAARKLAVAYLIPAAVWKSSYRLLLPEQGQPTLEGWAIVDNTTGDDWTNVQLTVVSGRPISFVSPLYEPRYRDRPVAELADDGAQAPVVFAGAVTSPPPPPAPAAAPKAPPRRARQMAEADMAMAEPLGSGAAADRVEVTASSVAVSTEGREAGDLFEYRFGTPVTVRKDQSAMLPFLQQPVTARKLLIYSDGSSVHPRSAAEITNNTGKTLDGGPITVFDAGSYAGEALVETLKAGDKRLIAYAVDLGTRVTTRYDTGAKVVRQVSLRRGLLTTRVAERITRTYSVRNVDARAKTLIVEHPARPDTKLISPTATERTATAIRFEVKLPANGEATLPVVEEREYANTITLTNLSADVLASYASNTELPAGARQKLTQVQGLQQKLASLQRQATENEAEVNRLTADQDRLRRNIESLGRVAGQEAQVQAYARQLAEREAQLVKLRDDTTALRQQAAAVQEQVNELVQSLEF